MSLDGLPIKNTFIHFGAAGDEGGETGAVPKRALRRNQTEPLTATAGLILTAPPGPLSCTRSEEDDEASPCWIAAGAGSEEDSYLFAATPEPATPEPGSPRSTMSPGTATISLCDAISVDTASTCQEMGPCTAWPWVTPPEHLHKTPAPAGGTPAPHGCFPRASPELTPEPVPQEAWPPVPVITAPPFVMLEGICACFGFTLRLAGGVRPGLQLDRSCDDSSLVVQAVLPGGAVEAWNKQCAGGPKDAKVVRPGDHIISVNGRSGAQGILEECTEKELLKFAVVRGNLEVAGCLLRLAAAAQAPALGVTGPGGWRAAV